MPHIMIKPQEAADLAKRENAVFVDIRESDEFGRLRLPGARLAPLSVLSFMPALVEGAEAQKRPFIFFCHSGNRTRDNAAALEALGWPRTYILEGGLAAWQAAGLTVEQSRRPLPMYRQVQVSVGLLILLFNFLTHWSQVSHWLLYFLGAGLIFAGLSGFCGLAKLLSFLPWNRKKQD